MLAVFVIWGLDTEGDAENPVFNLCWGRRKRVGELLNLLIMKFEKLSSLKFENFKPYSVKNMQAIFGGRAGTETEGPGTHDVAGTVSNSLVNDNVVTSNNGTSIRSDS